MLGIGCDLADVERIEKAIARKGFKERVFTPEDVKVSKKESLRRKKLPGAPAHMATKPRVMRPGSLPKKLF